MAEWKENLSPNGVVKWSRCVAPGISILIHRDVDYDLQKWYVTTVPDFYNRSPLGSTKLEEAKVEALMRVKNRIIGVLESLKELK